MNIIWLIESNHSHTTTDFPSSGDESSWEWSVIQNSRIFDLILIGHVRNTVKFLALKKSQGMPENKSYLLFGC